MYKLSLVKKKKKVRRAAIITSIGAVGVTAMVIVAFLGRSVGTFTIDLHGDDVSLTLSETSDFANPTTHLACNGLVNFSGLQTVSQFNGERSYEQIHNENTDYTLGQERYGDSVSMRFFKYTFFIKNVGTLDATYDLEVSITDKKDPTNDAAPLDEYLRLAVFEGYEGAEDETRSHNQIFTPTYYARRSRTREQSDEGFVKEYIADEPGKANYCGEAELFPGDLKLCQITHDLDAGHVKMYTLLLWLEGYDKQSTVIPTDGSLRIGANINAYHKKITNQAD